MVHRFNGCSQDVSFPPHKAFGQLKKLTLPGPANEGSLDSHGPVPQIVEDFE